MVKFSKTFYLIILFPILIYNCSKSYQSENVLTFKNFDRTIEKHGIPFSDKLIGLPFDMDIVDSILVCQYFTDGTKVFNLFNLNNSELITTYGIRGRGPKEIVRPGLMSLIPEKRSIFLCDLGRKNVFYYFSIDSIIEFKNEYFPNNSYNFPDSVLMPITDLHYHKELFYLSCNSISKLTTMNQKGQIVDYFGDRLIYQGNQPDLGYAYSQRALLDISSEFNKIVLAYPEYDFIEILDTNGVSEKLIIGPDKLKPKFNYTYDGWIDYSTTNNISAYTDVIVDSNLIFALYNGQPGVIINDEGQPHASYPNNLFVFYLDGTLKLRYILDEGIFQMAIDSENKRAIMTSTQSSFPILIYDLHEAYEE
jgi:hypothetical protein